LKFCCIWLVDSVENMRSCSVSAFKVDIPTKLQMMMMMCCCCCLFVFYLFIYLYLNLYTFDDCVQVCDCIWQI
jgi:hypothetical protein